MNEMHIALFKVNAVGYPVYHTETAVCVRAPHARGPGNYQTLSSLVCPECGFHKKSTHDIMSTSIANGGEWRHSITT